MMSPLSWSRFLHYSETIAKKSGISAHFYSFSDPGAIKDLSSYDIAFLDIDMGDSSGIDLARTLRRETPGVVIVFLTNFIQYAPEGFEVQAFRYLLKRDMNEKLIPYFEAASKKSFNKRGFSPFRSIPNRSTFP